MARYPHVSREPHPGSATALLVAGALTALGASALFAWLAGEVVEGDVQRFDEAVLLWVAHHRSEAATVVFDGLSALGSRQVLLTLTIGAVVALALARRRGMAIALAVATVGASLLSTLFKLAFARARPDVALRIVRAHGYSFPSGHTIDSVVFFTTIALLVGSHVQSGPLRTFLVLHAALVGMLVACSRVYLGVHYPSDVIAGGLVGVAWSFAVVLAEARWRHGPQGGWAAPR